MLSGEDFAVRTPIDGGTISGNQNDPNGGWKAATLNLAQFQGRTIKLQFKHQQFGNSVSWFDNLSFNQGGASASHGPDAAPDGSLLELRNASQSAISASFSVPTDTQWLRMEYQLSNLDYGNGNEPLLVDVLSGSSFSSVTFISQGITSQANAGWKVAKLPVSQFQGQTIKIRLSTPQFGTRSVVRVDKLALLSPRATLTTPIVVDGTTYLNVPLTELGGITTNATMTITSLVVYDEYLDLNGSLHYNNTTLPFELTGDLYHSTIGNKDDKVLDLKDKLDNINIVNAAVRTESVLAVMGNRYTNISNLVLITHKPYTHQYTTFTLDNITIINDILAQKSKYNPDYTDDYWHTKIFNPISQSSSVDEVSAQYNSPNQEKSHWYSWVDENETCSIIQQIDFKTFIRGANNIGGGQGTFFATTKITRQRTNGEVRAHMRDVWPANACDGADSEISGLGLGSDEISLGNDYVIGSDILDQGDVFQEVEYAAMDAHVLAFYDQEDISIGLRLGTSLGWKPLAIAASLPLGDFGSRKSSSKIGAFPITEIPPPYTLRTNLSIKTLYLADTGTTAHTEATVACFEKHANSKSYLKITFTIPISHTRNYYRFPERVIYPSYYVDYFSGPC